MTSEELLIPRYEVIGGYPNSKLKLGNILTPDRMNPTFFGGKKKIPDTLIENPEKYPHLFRELSWWEHRKEEDMPMYLKHRLNLEDEDSWNYHKIAKWDMSILFGFENVEERIGCNLELWLKAYQYLPISEEEYLKNVSND